MKKEENKDKGYGYEIFEGKKYYYLNKYGTLPQSFFHDRFEAGFGNGSRQGGANLRYGGKK